MTILHILYNPHNPDQLIITGERCSSESSRTIHTSDSGTPPLHPVASDPDTLTKLVRQIISDPPLSETFLTLEFPRSEKGIVCSPEWESFVHQNQENPDSLDFFATPAIICRVDLLLHLTGEVGYQDLGFIPGGSCRFWTGVTRLAREIVMRGRYLPTTGKYHNGGICTLWTPVLSSYDQWRVGQLVRSIPAAQQRFLEYGSDDARIVRRETAIMLFLGAMINRIISLAEQEDPVDYSASFSSMERLRFAQELTALYYLHGYERHKMPITSPQITNGWKESFHAWSSLPKTAIPDDPPWTIVCRLEELHEDADNKPGNDSIPPKRSIWRISFFVRSTDEPDLFIPAHQCGTGLNLPPIALPGPDELEAALHVVSDTLTRVALNLACTYGGRFTPIVRIDETDLVRFLTHDAPKIRESGIHLILPDWWGSPVRKAQVSLLVREKPDTDTNSMVGLHTLLNFDYRIAVGDEIIDPAEFRRMVEQKTSVVKAGRRWVTIDQEQITRIINNTGKQFKKKSLSIADFLRLYARSENSDEDLTILADDAWTSNLIAFIRDGWKQIQEKTPLSFTGVLRSYQQIGLSFLTTCRSIGFGACLADDMGLGKTPQTIAYLLACKERGILTGPSLLVCPTSIIGNWERELARFSPELSFYTHHGAGRKKDQAFLDAARTHDLVITSYALVPRDLEYLSRLSFAVIILDEVQNIKNAHTKQFQAVRSLSSQHRIALTGTPVENHLTELWAIMEVLNPGFLGSLTTFQKTYANPIEKGGASEKAAELRRMIRPFLLRRVKTDTSVISDLPEKMEMQVYCSLTHEQAALYQATLNDLARDLHTMAGMTRRGRVLSALTRLKQICDHPALVVKSTQTQPERSGKMKRLIEMLEEVREEGDAAVVFTQYATFAQVLAKQMQTDLEREVLLLTGSTPRLKREEMIMRFMRSDGPQFFVISLKAGGTGLNLMRATHVFHIDRWWNPAVEDQATDRTYRIGQTRTVQVHLLIAAGTLEEQIDEMIQRKRAVADQVITSGEAWLTELPTGELMDILRLREQVFGDDI